MRTKFVVIGLIKNRDGQYLINQRYDPKIKDAHMKWDFFCGTIDFGESPEMALQREIKEESGLTVHVDSMIPLSYSTVWEHDAYKLHVIVLCYCCTLIGGNLEIGDEKIYDAKWISKEEFKNYDFLPSIKLFLDKINL